MNSDVKLYEKIFNQGNTVKSNVQNENKPVDVYNKKKLYQTKSPNK